MKRVRVIISGHVQGVLFRADTKVKADYLGIFGWIRNNHDGSVEAVFEGEDKKIEDILRWCRKGPVFAKVANVRIIIEKYTGEFKNFSIKY